MPPNLVFDGTKCLPPNPDWPAELKIPGVHLKTHEIIWDFVKYLGLHLQVDALTGWLFHPFSSVRPSAAWSHSADHPSATEQWAR